MKEGKNGLHSLHLDFQYQLSV